jgi:hypothetical protein
MPKITVGDIDDHYQIQGSGQPLLMIMGLSFSLLDWGTQLPTLLAPTINSSSSTTATQAKPANPRATTPSKTWQTTPQDSSKPSTSPKPISSALAWAVRSQ